MRKYEASMCQVSFPQTGRSDCRWVAVLVLEHVTQQLLHGGVSDGPVEEQQLYPLRVHKTQRGKKKQQLSEPEHAQEREIQNKNPRLRAAGNSAAGKNRLKLSRRLFNEGVTVQDSTERKKKGKKKSTSQHFNTVKKRCQSHLNNFGIRLSQTLGRLRQVKDESQSR